MQYSSDAPDASLCYWTTVDEANRITTLNDYMDKLALSKDWGNRNTVKVARIPAGIEVKYAVGTARAMELGEVEGAMSSLAIVVCGLCTVIGASIFSYIW